VSYHLHPQKYVCETKRRKDLSAVDQQKRKEDPNA